MKATKILGIIAGMSLALLSTLTIAGATEYQHELTDKKMSFAWTVNGDNLAVKLVAETEGWVGIGFNPVEKMAGANFILGYVKKGEAKIVDEFGHDDNKHKSDTKLGGASDVTLVEGTEVDGVTTIEFTIPLESGDKNDTKIDVNSDTTVLLGYGGGRDSFRAKHKYRSTFIVNLSSGVSEKKGK